MIAEVVEIALVEVEEEEAETGGVVVEEGLETEEVAAGEDLEIVVVEEVDLETVEAAGVDLETVGVEAAGVDLETVEAAEVEEVCLLVYQLHSTKQRNLGQDKIESTFI